jgi:hypothetical protein
MNKGFCVENIQMDRLEINFKINLLLDSSRLPLLPHDDDAHHVKSRQTGNKAISPESLQIRPNHAVLSS